MNYRRYFRNKILLKFSVYSLLVLWAFVFINISAKSLYSAVFSTSLESIDSSRFPSISSTITITTKKPLPEQLSDNFTLFEDDTKIDKWSAKTDSRPMYVSIVLDRSGSMSGSMAYLKKAACDFVSLMSDQTFCQVISFSDDVKINNSYTSNFSAVKRNIATLKPYGPTALYDALALSIKSLRYYPSSYRRVIVVFTDGKDQNADGTAKQSSATAKRVVVSARNEGLPIYTIGLGDKISTKILEKMATLTNGKFYHSFNREDLSSIFRSVAVSLRVSYNFTYKSPKIERDGTVRKLVIKSELFGDEDQGKGKYRAPKDVVSATSTDSGSNELNTDTQNDLDSPRLSQANHKLTTLLSNMFNRDKFGVDMTKEVSNWSSNRAGYPVMTKLHLEVDDSDHTNIRKLARIESSISSLRGKLEAIADKNNAHVEFRPTHTPKFDIDLEMSRVSDVNSLAFMTGKGIAVTVMPLKALTDIPFTTDIDLMVKAITNNCRLSMNGADCIVLTPTDIDSQISRIFFNVQTMLPRMVVTSNPENGATATTKYETWFKEVNIPPVPEPVQGEINIDGAIKLAANISLATVSDLREMSALQNLGPSLQLLSETTVKTNLKSIDEFNSSFAKATDKFNSSMDAFQKNLDDDLMKMTSNLEKQMENFNKDLDEDLDKLSASLNKHQRDFESNLAGQMNTLNDDMKNIEKNLGNDIEHKVLKTIEKNVLNPGNLGNEIQKNVNDYLNDSGITGSSGWGTSGDNGSSGWNDNSGSSSWNDSDDDDDSDDEDDDRDDDSDDDY